METTKHPLFEEDVTELFKMLQSTDNKTVDSVKALIQENLSTRKDQWLLNGLVDYYMAAQSIHALDIIIRVREPHDKHLFCKVNECLRSFNTRYNCLLLLSHIVHRQPSWLYKITQHKTFQALLNILKTETDSPCIMCALLSVVSLLPIIPSQMAPYLTEVFDIFSRLVAWTVKPSGIPEIFVLHLQVAVYSLFHRLYGMYPCNFLGYLRSYYGGRKYETEDSRVFNLAIKPMLSKVKLHPLLVTASNQAEQNYKRWRRMAPHDIIAECASISLDRIEGMAKTFRSNDCSLDYTSSVFSQDSSIHCNSLTSLSSNISLTVEQNSLLYDVNQAAVWSPSHICDISTPLITSIQSDIDGIVIGAPDSQNQAETNSTVENMDQKLLTTDIDGSTDEKRVSVTDFDVGEQIMDPALQDSMKSDSFNADSVDTEACDKPKPDEDLFQPFEAREEELIDEEVSDLTRTIVKPNPSEIRNDTPFCSTTQNLTDKPTYSLIQDLDGMKSCEDTYEASEPLTQEQSELKMNNFVQSINRLRYFSYCGIQPLPLPVEKPVACRPSSCPNFKLKSAPENLPLGSANTLTADTQQELSQDKCNAAAQDATDSCSNQGANISFIDMQSDPLPITHSLPATWKLFGVDQTAPIQAEYTPIYTTFSPAELLDRHIQMGNDAFLNQLCPIPLTSTKDTNWTHFGGKPPADEIALLRTQILLLHNQLMFERHRREMHSERNRRLLGKAKKTQMREEQIFTLQDQVVMLQKETENLKKQMNEQAEIFRNLSNKTEQSKIETMNNLRKLSQENTNLLYSNQNLQSLLVSQKVENDAIKKEKTSFQSQLADLQFELQLCKQDSFRLQNVKAELFRMSKENILLQELNQQCEDQLKFPKESAKENAEELLNESAQFEIKNLKQALELKTLELEIVETKLKELEENLQIANAKIDEHARIYGEKEKLHKDEINVRDMRLKLLMNIHSTYEEHILELYQTKEKFENQLKLLNPNFTEENENLEDSAISNYSSACKNFLDAKSDVDASSSCQPTNSDDSPLS